MAADGLSGADIDAVRDHLVMLRANELIPTKPHVLRQLVESVLASSRSKQSCPAQGLPALPPGRRAGGACCGHDRQ